MQEYAEELLDHEYRCIRKVILTPFDDNVSPRILSQNGVKFGIVWHEVRLLRGLWMMWLDTRHQSLQWTGLERLGVQRPQRSSGALYSG